MKKQNHLLFFVLISSVCFGVAGVVYFLLFCCQKPANLTCVEPIFDFGCLPIQNGRSVGQHVFFIDNNTDFDIAINKISVSCSCVDVQIKSDVIPKHGKLEVAAQIVLNQKQLNDRVVDIIVLPESKAIAPLKLSVVARVGFSAFSSPQEIDFNNVFIGKQKIYEVDIIRPNKTKMENFVKKLVLSDGNSLEIGKIRYANRRVKNNKEDEFFENKAIIPVIIDIKNKMQMGAGSQRLDIELTTGEKLAIPIRWNVYERAIFEPRLKRYVLGDLQENQTRDFSVIYNVEVGGRVKSITTGGNGLGLVTYGHDGEFVFIKLKYTSGATVKVDETVGELVVETEDGKTHKLEIIAS